jgi:acyl dehydratase
VSDKHLKNIVGLRGPDYSVPIEWGAIRQFAKSVYSGHPAWLNDPSAVVPPTFLVSAGYHWGYILERPPQGSEIAAIGADHGVLLDGEQAFIFHGPPPRAGMVLSASTRVFDHYKKRSKAGGQLEFFVMQTDFTDAAGRLVCEWRPTSIRTEDAPVQSYAAREGSRPWFHKGEKREQFKAIVRTEDAALERGTGPGPVTMPPLTLTEMIRYQCASGEDSPGHHDILAARAFGYPDVFSVGMHHAGVLATYACHWLGPQNVREFRARFLHPVWPGDILSYQGVVTDFADSNEGPVVNVELVCRRDADVVVRAWGRFLRGGP